MITSTSGSGGVRERTPGPLAGSTTDCIPGMKISVSLPSDDVAFLDEYAEAHAISSRSAVVAQAIAALRAMRLPAEYGQAWEDWAASGERSVWDNAAGDGV